MTDYQFEKLPDISEEGTSQVETQEDNKDPMALNEQDLSIRESLQKIRRLEEEIAEKNQRSEEIEREQKFKNEVLPQINQQFEKEYYSTLMKEKFKDSSNSKVFMEFIRNTQKTMGPASNIFTTEFLKQIPDGDAFVNMARVNSQYMQSFLKPFYQYLDESNNPLYTSKNNYKNFSEDPSLRNLMAKGIKNIMKIQSKKISNNILKSYPENRYENQGEKMQYNYQAGNSDYNSGELDNRYSHLKNDYTEKHFI